MKKKAKIEKEILHTIQFCRFTRKKKGANEYGLLLNEGSLKILDQYGKILKECYEFRVVHGTPTYFMDAGVSFDLKRLWMPYCRR